jgi:hypothetical protein
MVNQNCSYIAACILLHAGKSEIKVTFYDQNCSYIAAYITLHAGKSGIKVTLYYESKL